MELFGNNEQRAMMKRGAALRQITKNDPRFSYYGRNVALTEYSSDAVELVSHLSLIQGASSCLYVQVDRSEEFKSAIDNLGFMTDQFELWQGGDTALAASENIVKKRKLPSDLEVVDIGPDTPGEIMAGLNEVTESCGVLLPLGSVMRGLDAPSVCKLAMDSDGVPVASAAAVAFNHPNGAHCKDVWWGMLATREDRRGEGIAIIMGAMAMLFMHQHHGFSNFTTGIRQGNEASERLCQKLGFSSGKYQLIAALDPKQFTGGRMTK